MRYFLWLVICFGLAIPLAPAQRQSDRVAEIGALIRSHDLDRAMQETKASLKAKPTDYRLWTLDAVILSMQGNDSAAIAAFDHALRLEPNYLPALQGEAQLLYAKHDKRAGPLLERLLKLNQSDSTAHEMLGVLQREQGKCAQAIGHFETSVDSLYRHSESLESYGACLVELHKFEDAVPVFEKLADLHPASAYAKYNLALVLSSAKQFNAAIKALDPLLATDHADPDILSLASRAYEATGNTPQAVALLRKAIMLSPTTPEYYVVFATICLDHDSFQIGIEMMNAGLQYLPTSSILFVSRGLLYAQLGKYEEAEGDFARAGEFDRRQSISLYASDLAAVQKNNPEQALAQLRSQRKEHPDSPLLNFLFAKLVMDQSPEPGSVRFKEAMRACELAIQGKPDLVDARDLIAGMYMSLGQFDVAAEQSKLALQYVPSDEAAMYHLLMSYRRLGKKDELKTLVKSLAELHQQSLQKELDRKKYRLVGETIPVQ